MTPEWVAAAQAVAVAVVVVVGQRLVARYSKQANDKTAAVQEKANGLDGMDKLVHNLETRLEKVEERADRLADRVRALEEERVRDKSLIRHLWAYAITLRDALRAAGRSIPEPPGALDFDVPLP